MSLKNVVDEHQIQGILTAFKSTFLMMIHFMVYMELDVLTLFVDFQEFVLGVDWVRNIYVTD